MKGGDNMPKVYKRVKVDCSSFILSELLNAFTKYFVLDDEVLEGKISDLMQCIQDRLYPDNDDISGLYDISDYSLYEVYELELTQHVVNSVQSLLNAVDKD